MINAITWLDFIIVPFPVLTGTKSEQIYRVRARVFKQLPAEAEIPEIAHPHAAQIHTFPVKIKLKLNDHTIVQIYKSLNVNFVITFVLFSFSATKGKFFYNKVCCM